MALITEQHVDWPKHSDGRPKARSELTDADTAALARAAIRGLKPQMIRSVEQAPITGNPFASLDIELHALRTGL